MKRRDRQQKQAERQKNRQQVRQTRESRRKGSQDKRERRQEGCQVREKEGNGMKVTQIQEEVSGMNLSSDDTCPKCGLLYSADSGMWIACDLCENWFNLSCTNIIDSKKLPDVFYCENCVVNPCVSETDRDLCNDKEWLTSVCLIMGTLSHISITNKWYLL